MNLPIITLLTDFGTADHYVAAMKGVILKIAPQANLVDISHDLDAHNILAGAFVLHNTLPWFPPGTIHVAVVDPGVGSDRHIIAGQWGDQIIIAPDNGLVSWVEQQQPSQEIYQVSNPAYFLPEISNTFHGRDIMAPTAAHLATGQPLSSVGPRIDQPLTIHLPQPRRDGEQLIGQIIYADRFGNLISNITATQTREFSPTSVRLKRRNIAFAPTTYSDADVGKPLALVGSSAMLEIAINQGNAGQELNADIGDEIVLLR